MTYEIFFAILGIILAAYIAFRQEKQLKIQQKQLKNQEVELKDQQEQLKRLHKIGIDTRSTAIQLKSDAAKKTSFAMFLGAKGKSIEQYVCVFPVFYDRKPLPFIQAGDYHVLQVLQNLFEPDQFSLKEMPDIANDQINCVEGNVLYLCSPQANKELRTLASAVTVKNKVSDCLPYFKGVSLPCWFANSTDERHYNNEEVKTIWIPDKQEVLYSDSEDEYRAADLLKPKLKYGNCKNIQKDYAILMRLTIDDQMIIVIAGIHQYGTWICGDFFKRLFIPGKINYRKQLLGEADCLSVIWGEFNTITLKTEECNVERNYVWTRNITNNTWEQVQAMPEHKGS